MSYSDYQLPSNRKFGFFFTFVFAFVSSYFFYSGHEPLFYCILIISILFLLVTIIDADILNPLNRLWMSFGLLLGKIVSPIVMGTIFFGLFTPVGLFMRLFGRDELHLKTTKRKSHWRDRQHADAVKNHFENQF